MSLEINWCNTTAIKTTVIKNISNVHLFYNHNKWQCLRTLVSRLFLTRTFWKERIISFFIFNFQTIVDKTNVTLLNIPLLPRINVELKLIKCRIACACIENEVKTFSNIEMEVRGLIMKSANFLWVILHFVNDFMFSKWSNKIQQNLRKQSFQYLWLTWY